MTPAAAPAPAHDLGELLGLRGPSILWGRVLTFFLAWWLCSLPATFYMAQRFGRWPDSSFWIFDFLGSLLLTALLVISMRNISGDIGAALVACVAYALLAPVVQWLSRPSGFRSLSLLAPLPHFGPFFALLGVALALRQVRPQWLALWVGSLAGFTFSYLFFWLWSAAYLARAHAPLGLSSQDASALALNLLTATLFALVFEGLSRLLE
jgi:hypothetical protein